VVVPSLGRPSVRAAVASVLASAEHAGAPVEVIVGWQGAEPPVLPSPARAVPALAAGISFARNAGLAAARAPIVAFIDDDELADLGWVAGVLEAFADPRVDAAFGQVLPFEPGAEPYCEIRHDALKLVRGTRRPPWEVGTGGNMAYRRSALESLGGFDVRLGQGTAARSAEDTDVIARLQTSGATLALSPRMVVFHPVKSAAERLASRRPYGRGMGTITRRERSPRLVTHFAVGCFWALRALVAEPSWGRAHELVDTVRGWTEGVLNGDRWHAPPVVVTRAPAPVAEALAGRPVRGLPVDGDQELRYACGDDLLLRVRPGNGALPAGARAAALSAGATWVLEERP
jgi:glycosyl transferase family 2